MDKYSVILKIGTGTCGTAYLVQSDDGRRYVLKKVELSAMAPKQQAAAHQEVKLLSELDHPLILGYVDSFEHKGKLCIVTEFCEAGDLCHLLKKQTEPLPEEQVLDWFAQICLAIKYVHDRNVLHRDLKTQNIFLTKDGDVKLGDFGIARVLTSPEELAQTVIGTPYYMSPEIIQSRPYDFKSDVWSLGCVLYEMTTRTHPFEASDLHTLMNMILHGQTRPIGSKYSADLQDLISSMLERDPERRPSLDTILALPFLRETVERCKKVVDKLRLRRRVHPMSRRAQPADSPGPSNPGLSPPSGGAAVGTSHHELGRPGHGRARRGTPGELGILEAALESVDSELKKISDERSRLTQARVHAIAAEAPSSGRVVRRAAVRSEMSSLEPARSGGHRAAMTGAPWAPHVAPARDTRPGVSMDTEADPAGPVSAPVGSLSPEKPPPSGVGRRGSTERVARSLDTAGARGSIDGAPVPIPARRLHAPHAVVEGSHPASLPREMMMALAEGPDDARPGPEGRRQGRHRRVLSSDMSGPAKDLSGSPQRTLHVAPASAAGHDASTLTKESPPSTGSVHSAGLYDEAALANMHPKARMRARKEMEIRKREQELLEARKRYFEERRAMSGRLGLRGMGRDEAVAGLMGGAVVGSRPGVETGRARDGDGVRQDHTIYPGVGCLPPRPETLARAGGAGAHPTARGDLGGAWDGEWQAPRGVSQAPRALGSRQEGSGERGGAGAGAGDDAGPGPGSGQGRHPDAPRRAPSLSRAYLYGRRDSAMSSDWEREGVGVGVSRDGRGPREAGRDWLDHGRDGALEAIVEKHALLSRQIDSLRSQLEADEVEMSGGPGPDLEGVMGWRESLAEKILEIQDINERLQALYVLENQM